MSRLENRPDDSETTRGVAKRNFWLQDSGTYWPLCESVSGGNGKFDWCQSAFSNAAPARMSAMQPTTDHIDGEPFGLPRQLRRYGSKRGSIAVSEGIVGLILSRQFRSLESASGHKRKSATTFVMSALPLGTDILWRVWHVRKVPSVEI